MKGERELFAQTAYTREHLLLILLANVSLLKSIFEGHILRLRGWIFNAPRYSLTLTRSLPLLLKFLTSKKLAAIIMEILSRAFRVFGDAESTQTGNWRFSKYSLQGFWINKPFAILVQFKKIRLRIRQEYFLGSDTITECCEETERKWENS